MPAKADRGRRLALIIAGSTYSDPTLQKLRAPGKDASDLAEVLADPAIGGFDVDILVDAPAQKVKSGIFDFCEQARPGDLLLLYLSCHGVLDDRGRLYYAATDTQSRRLGLTGIPSEWLNDQLEDCRARREILILDCCHSGAFAKGTKGESALALKEKFGGRGKAVLTASRATEYSFEGEAAVGDDVRSIFTNAIVQGLRSGEADRDRDGLVTVEDLYHYVYETVRQAEPRQTPEWWVSNGEGEFVVAHSVRGAIITPVPLSKHVTEILESPHAEVRESGVKVLARLLEQGAPERGPTVRQSGLALSARQRLQQIVEDDLPRIAIQAEAALSAGSEEATADLSAGSEEATADLSAGSEEATADLSGGSGVAAAELASASQVGSEIPSESPEPGATEESPEPAAIGTTTESPPTSQPSEPGDQPAPSGPQQAADLTYDPDYFPALDAYFAGRWDEAVDLWSALAGRYPNEQIVASKLAEARKNKDLADVDLAARHAAELRTSRQSHQSPQPGAHAAKQRNQDSTAYKPGDKVEGHVLGADYVWHPLAQGPPPRGFWKAYFGRLWWMYLLCVIAAVLISGWSILSDYLDKTLAGADIPPLVPSYLQRSAIIAAIVAALADLLVTALLDWRQRRRRARWAGGPRTAG
jgi:hypothetical protein